MNENVKDLPCSPEVNKKLISKYKGEQQNIIFNILNRQNTGYFCKNQRKRCHDHHDAVQPKFIFKGKQSEIFMGLTACGQFLVSYYKNSNNAYELSFWIYRPPSMMKRYYTVPLLIHEWFFLSWDINMMQWSTDSKTLIVYGITNDYGRINYDIIVLRVPQLGCLEYTRHNTLCIKCNLTIHMTSPDRFNLHDFTIKSHLNCPGYILMTDDFVINWFQIKLDMNTSKNVNQLVNLKKPKCGVRYGTETIEKYFVQKDAIDAKCSSSFKVFGSGYSPMKLISWESKLETEGPIVTITHHSFDVLSFVHYVVYYLCHKKGLDYDEWSYELVDLCPLTEIVTGILSIQFDGYVNCKNTDDCNHNHGYESHTLFYLHLDTGECHVIDHHEKKARAFSYGYSKVGQLKKNASVLKNKLFGDRTSSYGYLQHLRILDTKTFKVAQKLDDNNA